MNHGKLLGFPACGLLSNGLNYLRFGHWIAQHISTNASELKRNNLDLHVKPSTCASLLQVSSDLKTLVDGQHVHHHLVFTGHERSKYLGSFLVQMYIKCASLEDASAWFSHMYERNLFSWNLMMGAVPQHQEVGGGSTLRMFFQMQQEGVMPNRVTYAIIFSACVSQAVNAEGIQMHARIAGSVLESDVVVASAMINMYVKCSSIEKAKRMFDRVVDRDCITWNTLLAAHANHEHGRDALQMFYRMSGEGVLPDKVTFASILSTFSKNKALADGKKIHACIKSSRLLDSDIAVGNALVSMYGNCCGPESAQNMFNEIPEHDVVSWNTVAAVFVNQGFSREAICLFRQMHQQGVMPDKVTFLSILSACTLQELLQEAKRIHTGIMYSGFETDVVVKNVLVHVYGKCGKLGDADRVFDDIREVDVLSWNVIISAYAQSAQSAKALQLFDRMHQETVIPDKVTYISSLAACTCEEAFARGKHMHTCIVNNGFGSDVVISNALITFYSKNGDLQEAQRMFDMAKERDLVSWNAMIAAYSMHGHGKEALDLFNKMRHKGINPDKVTLVAILDVFAYEGALCEEKKLHTFLLDNGIKMDVVVATALLNMYVKCDSLETAKVVFNTMPQRSAISWNSMLTAYFHTGNYEQVLQLFIQMQCEGEVPDEVTYITIISACSNETRMAEGERLHTRILHSDFESANAILNAIMVMYSKCGALEVAHAVFIENLNPDQASWNALSAAYSQYGHGMEVLQLHNQMQRVGAVPDKATFICLLSACSYAGLLHEGHSLFTSMQGALSGTLSSEHYDCMIDLFGRAGLLDQVEVIVSNMPFQPTDVSWLTLLAACKTQLDVERAECVAKHIFELDKENVNPYIMLSNIYTVAGRVMQDMLATDEDRETHRRQRESIPMPVLRSTLT